MGDWRIVDSEKSAWELHRASPMGQMPLAATGEERKAKPVHRGRDADAEEGAVERGGSAGRP